MRANLMTAAAVVMLVGVVFVATLISQYSGTPDPGPVASGTDPVLTGPPLRFTVDKMMYDPASEELPHRHFTGFYEVSPELVPASFWFQNVHPSPVELTVRGRSCTSCTSARVAVIKPGQVDALAVTAGVVGLGRGADLVTALTAANLMAGLEWQPLNFDTPDTGVLIPAAASPTAPTWGVFQLEVKVVGVGPKSLTAEAGLRVGNLPPVRQGFEVMVLGMNPFEVEPPRIDLGTMAEDYGVRHFDLTVWSATRTPDRLPPPAAAVNVRDPFVAVGAAVALTPDERARVAANFATQGRPYPVTAGYRIPVTVHRRRPADGPTAGPAEPDIGPFDRQIGITSGGNYAPSVALTGTVTGAVSLVDGGAIDLKDFPGAAGVERSNFNLVSDRLDLSLAVVPAECKPQYLKASLSEPRVEGGRRFWTLKVVVPPGVCFEDLPPDSVLVLAGTRDGQTVRVRLPVKGRGYSRGR